MRTRSLPSPPPRPSQLGPPVGTELQGAGPQGAGAPSEVCTFVGPEGRWWEQARTWPGLPCDRVETARSCAARTTGSPFPRLLPHPAPPPALSAGSPTRAQRLGAAGRGAISFSFPLPHNPERMGPRGQSRSESL